MNVFLREGWGSCNFFIEESAGCSRHSSCFKHFTTCNLYIGFTQLMTKSFISEFPYVERYFWTMVNQPNFKKVLGEVKQISLFPVTKKHLSRKNLLNQGLRMNPKMRNQQSPNQNLVRKRRLQSPNLRILLIYCPQVRWYESGWVEEAVLKYQDQLQWGCYKRLLLSSSFDSDLDIVRCLMLLMVLSLSACMCVMMLIVLYAWIFWSK